MKKLLIILLFLPILGLSQQPKWSGAYGRSHEISIISKGADTIWMKPMAADTIFTFTTTSTYATFEIVTEKTGATLKWYVNGAVTGSQTSNTFNLNITTAGTKTIIATSTDGASGLTSLQIYGGGSETSSMDVSELTNLVLIEAISLGFSSVDVTNNTALAYLSLTNSSLTSIDLSNNTDLTELYLGVNGLTSIDISNNTLLVGLGVQQNSLTSLDISNNTELVNVACYTNQLTTLNISSNSLINTLNVNDNAMTKIAVDAMLDNLISFGLTTGRFDCNSQTPTITPDATKVQTLRTQGWTVNP